jgi:hypothetical protein
MSANLVEQYTQDYLESGVATSLILGFLERAEVDDPRQPPRTASYVADLGSISGIKRELANILENQSGRDGYVKSYGRLNYARMKKKEAQQRWQTHLASQPNLPKVTPPSGHWARDIARWRAAELVCERESRALHKRLGELQQAEERERTRKAEMMRWKGIGKLVDNKLVMMDGRAVEDGNFVDDGSGVKEYLEEVKRRKRARQLKKKQAASAVA